MREIKFRGKRKDNGEWVYGWYVEDWEGLTHIITNFGPIITHCLECGANDQRSYEVDPETVGQYTGLKGKNGKEIYEGDILERVSLLTEQTYHYKVVWDEEVARFISVSIHGTLQESLITSIKRGCVKVGTIYEHPHLLGEASA